MQKNFHYPNSTVKEHFQKETQNLQKDLSVRERVSQVFHKIDFFVRNVYKKNLYSNRVLVKIKLFSYSAIFSFFRSPQGFKIFICINISPLCEASFFYLLGKNIYGFNIFQNSIHLRSFIKLGDCLLCNISC